MNGAPQALRRHFPFLARNEIERAVRVIGCREAYATLDQANFGNAVPDTNVEAGAGYAHLSVACFHEEGALRVVFDLEKRFATKQADAAPRRARSTAMAVSVLSSTAEPSASFTIRCAPTGRDVICPQIVNPAAPYPIRACDDDAQQQPGDNRARQPAPRADAFDQCLDSGFVARRARPLVAHRRPQPLGLIIGVEMTRIGCQPILKGFQRLRPDIRLTQPGMPEAGLGKGGIGYGRRGGFRWRGRHRRKSGIVLSDKARSSCI